VWEGEAKTKRIIGQNMPERQWGPTIHQIRHNLVKTIQLGKPRKAAHLRRPRINAPWDTEDRPPRP